MAVKFARVTDVRLVELPRHVQQDGQLVVIEQGKAMAFPVARMFTVRATGGAVRGRHAHKECAQFLVCVYGAVEVECDDGSSKSRFTLNEGNLGLLVPPTIWASETYLVADSVLTVLCDRPYEPEDYVRDYDQFLAWRASDG